MDTSAPRVVLDYPTCSVPPECVDALHGCYLYFNIHHFDWQMTSEESMQKSCIWDVGCMPSGKVKILKYI